MKSARERHCYAVTRDDAIGVMGDMWKSGLFLVRFTSLGYRHAIGSQLVDGRRPLARRFDRVYTPGKRNPIARGLMNGNAWASLSSLPGLPARPREGREAPS